MLPQPTQAHGRPQLQRLGLLAAGNLESLVKTLLWRSRRGGMEAQQQLSFEPIQLRLPAALARGVRKGQRLGQHGQPFCGLLGVPIRLGQHRKMIRPSHLGSCSPPGSHALAQVRYPRLSLSLRGQRPAPHDGS